MKLSQKPIHPDTTLGPVHLNVGDLKNQIAFYREAIGFELLHSKPSEASLGVAGKECLRLTEVSGPKRQEQGAGLYHFCILVPDRLELARLLQRLTLQHRSLQGLVDHRMAEAIYLSDPEGNGIELNWDRPRTEWPNFRDLMRLGNAPLDVEGLGELLEHSVPGPGTLPSNARVSHIHLHVAHLDACRDFYHGILGFDIMGEFPGQAVFTSAGGYHHHIAFNIWHGEGAASQPEGSLGLQSFTVLSPNQEELERNLERVQVAGLSVQRDGKGGFVADPSGNKLYLSSI